MTYNDTHACTPGAPDPAWTDGGRLAPAVRTCRCSDPKYGPYSQIRPQIRPGALKTKYGQQVLQIRPSGDNPSSHSMEKLGNTSHLRPLPAQERPPFQNSEFEVVCDRLHYKDPEKARKAKMQLAVFQDRARGVFKEAQTWEDAKNMHARA